MIDMLWLCTPISPMAANIPLDQVDRRELPA